MTRFNHSILFFFALALALLCCAVVMLQLNQARPGWGFGALVATAVAVALLVPAAGALASLRFIRWRQPLTAWLTFDLIAVLIAAVIASRLLG